MLDFWAYRRRQTTGRRNGKLSPKQVREIWALKDSHAFSSDLAKKYGVKKGVVYGIWAGKTYREITMAGAYGRPK